MLPFIYVGGIRSYVVGMRTLCRVHEILRRGNVFLCCGNEIKNVVGTRSYVVGTR